MTTLNERLAWLAGIIDGEGAICSTLYRRKNGGEHLIPAVPIANTNEALIRGVAAIADEIGVGYNITPKPRRDRRRAAWQISFMGLKRVEKILTAVEPYIVAKKPQLELMLSVVRHRKATMDVRPGRGPRSKPSGDEWLMKSLGDLKFLNRRGPRPEEERVP